MSFEDIEELVRIKSVNYGIMNERELAAFELLKNIYWDYFNGQITQFEGKRLKECIKILYLKEV